jgi:hypothetical protein
LRFAPDGRRLLTASSNNTFLARANQLVPSGGSDTTLLLWDVETARLIQRFEGHRDGITDAVFTPDGRWLLSSSLDRTIRVWETATGSELQRWTGATAPVMTLALAADGRRVLAGCRDGTASVWDVAAGAEVSRYLGARSIVLTALSPDGRYAAAVDATPILHLWEADTGKNLHRLLLPSPELVPARDGNPVGAGLQLAFTTGGTEVLVVYRDQRYQIRWQRWQVGSGVPTAAGVVRDGAAWPWPTLATALSADGRRLLLGGSIINGHMSVTLLDTATMQLIYQFQVPHGVGLGLSPLAALSPDGRLAAITQPDSEETNGTRHLHNNLVRLYRMPK